MKKQIQPIIFVVAILMSFWVIATATAQGPSESEGRAMDEFATPMSPEMMRQTRVATNAATTAIPVQGQLTDSAGQPINGNKRITFALYKEASGGQALCEAAQANVPVSSGFFNTTFELSETVCNGLYPTLVLNSLQLYLGIKVEANAEMTPRQKLLPVPYAFSVMAGANIDGTMDGSYSLFVVNHGREVTISNTKKIPQAIFGWSSPTSGEAYGLYGFSSSNVGQGVRGYAGSSSGTTYGIYGRSVSTNGRGVYGFASITSSTATGERPIGVYGVSQSPQGHGVRGYVNAKVGLTVGVSGLSDSNEGIGIYGLTSAATGTTNGVVGETFSENGKGVVGKATSTMMGTTYGVYGLSASPQGTGVYGIAEAITGTTYGVYGKSNADMGMGVYGIAEAITGTTYGVYGKSNTADGAAVMGYNTTTGVGVIARSEQGNPLEAYGSVATETVFKVTNQGNVYAQGSYHCGGVISETATMISETMTITGATRSDLSPCLQDHNEADFAEMLPSHGDSLEAGDVLAINLDGELVRSETAYQATVVGVYSTKPSYLGSSQLLGQANHVPLALVGIVPVKVTAENGSIKPGDLLTTSNMPGHAMRADATAPNGTVIGKALAGLESGTGMIRVLVMLQ